ncbi:MAG TPA: ClpXP protease specificity-enhancing factor SspB [Alphaproteobacteria bacterium]|nr:ClpXP protease specificity-enhancing factor SspB [Alphaproteobacteria bacterium]
MAKITTINYEHRVQQALRDVIKDVLKQTQEHGLSGKHHFYLTFKTDFPAVIMPDFLKTQYPDEITIVLQHEYWDLEVDEKSFAVTLSFNDTTERLSVPFAALVSFVDPSVKFGLQFSPTDEDLKEAAQTHTVIEESPEHEETTDSSQDSNVITLDRFRKK